ncbi:MAG: hypothetical protein K2P14_03690 [Anaeroplasmataceae bacterium]|nr:hypothetical protein [Anaeroplasmataceae bacterium]
MYFITSINENDSRCIGYVSDLDIAKNIVKNNRYDLYEAGCYPNVVIERIPEGIYQYDFEPLWFEYDENSNKYTAMTKKPSYIQDNAVGFGIG